MEERRGNGGLAVKRTREFRMAMMDRKRRGLLPGGRVVGVVAAWLVLTLGSALVWLPAADSAAESSLLSAYGLGRLQVPANPALAAFVRALVAGDLAAVQAQVEAQPDLLRAEFRATVPDYAARPSSIGPMQVDISLNAAQVAVLFSDNAALLEWLLDHQVDVQAGVRDPAASPNRRRPFPTCAVPLTAAVVERQRFDFGEILVRHSVPVDFLDSYGTTALSAAMGQTTDWRGTYRNRFNFNPTTANWLLDHGADPNAYTANGPVGSGCMFRLALWGQVLSFNGNEGAHSLVIRRIYWGLPQWNGGLQLLLFALAVGVVGAGVWRYNRQHAWTPAALAGAEQRFFGRFQRERAGWEGVDLPRLPQAELHRFLAREAAAARWQRWSMIPAVSALVTYGLAQQNPFLSRLDIWGIFALEATALGVVYLFSWIPVLWSRMICWALLAIGAFFSGVGVTLRDAFLLVHNFEHYSLAAVYLACSGLCVWLTVLAVWLVWLNFCMARFGRRYRKSMTRKPPPADSTGIEDQAGWDEGRGGEEK